MGDRFDEFYRVERCTDDTKGATAATARVVDAAAFLAPFWDTVDVIESDKCAFFVCSFALIDLPGTIFINIVRSISAMASNPGARASASFVSVWRSIKE